MAILIPNSSRQFTYRVWITSLAIRSPHSIQERSMMSCSPTIMVGRKLASASNVDTKRRSPSSCPLSQNKQFDMSIFCHLVCSLSHFCDRGGTIFFFFFALSSLVLLKFLLAGLMPTCRVSFKISSCYITAKIIKWKCIQILKLFHICQNWHIGQKLKIDT